MTFYTLILLHLLLTMGYFLLNMRRKPRLHTVTETIIVFAVPFFGLLLMVSYRIICYYLNLTNGKRAEDETDEKVLFRGIHLDEDIIPLNDAYLVDDVQKKRNYFTDAIKQAVVDNESILQMAMHDRDREIAYYAVSMLTSKMEKLENELFSKESMIIKWEGEGSINLLEEYTQMLKSYLAHKKFIDHVTYRKKQGDYIGLLDYLKKMCPDKMEYYTEEVEQLLSTGNYTEAEFVCAELKEHFPQKEESYMMYIKLYQSWRKPKQLQQKIRELKACPIELSQEALRTIRYWDKEISREAAVNG
ncbi:hypothetical protein [Selenomonas ruminantium]|uniref:Uncharacterized protein n=1 Tax=Selenomonas ruminantium TaxID=971 RepID=A0A1I0WJ68_SELRU|nr:hypothetical protein [Selenomonas ruminantium]SFA88427.1 hypothetical protein SAMN05216587_10312 [Selenomonas ruminantium]